MWDLCRKADTLQAYTRSMELVYQICSVGNLPPTHTEGRSLSTIIKYSSSPARPFRHRLEYMYRVPGSAA